MLHQLKKLHRKPGHGSVDYRSDCAEFARLHGSGDDAGRLGIQDQELVWISSRRGKVMSRAAVKDRVNTGAVYMTYQWWIGACNELTIHHVDPISKTPEYKYGAVAVQKIEDQSWAERYVQDEYGKIKAQMNM